MKPASNPEHYAALKRELEELPSRGWMENMWRRLKGMVRLR